MIGKDYSRVSAKGFHLAKLHNGSATTFEGPIKIIGWLNTVTLIIIDRSNSIYVQTISGHIYASLLSKHFSPVKGGQSSRTHDDRKVIDGFDILAIDACVIPHSQKMVVVDSRHYTTNINTDDWTYSRGFGKNKEHSAATVSEFDGMNSIACFTYQEETLYCICDSVNDNIKIVSDRNTVELCIGTTGSLPYQFSEPVCIACHIPLKIREIEKSQESQLPNWYLGIGYPIDQIHKLFAIDPYLGKFYVILRDYRKDHEYKYRTENYYGHQELETMDVYDLFFISSIEPMTVDNLVILAIPNQENDVVITIEKTKPNYDRDKFFEQKREQERSHKILVQDCIFQLSCDSDFSPIGKQHESLHELLRSQKFLQRVDDKRPFVLIAVGEKGNSRVQTLRCFWIRSNLYRPSIDKTDILGVSKESKLKLEHPVSIDYSTDGDLVICDSGLRRIFVFTPLLTLIKSFSVAFSYSDRPTDNTDAGSDTVIDKNERNDDVPVTVSFASDGKLAVGYKRGGILIYPAPRSMSVGDAFETIPLPILLLIFTYFEYSDIQGIRGCCKYFFNYTTDLRLRWDILPLRKRAGDYLVVLFLKWSRSTTWNTEKDKGTRKKLKEFKDVYGNEICTKFLNMKNCVLNNHGKCPMMKCHHPLDLNFSAFELSEFYIELKYIMLISIELFDLAFVWKFDRYIESLFSSLCSDRILHSREDPMTRHNEVLRKVVLKTTSVLDFRGYLELMTVLEEEFTGAFPLKSHPLFNPKLIQQKQIVGRFHPVLALKPQYYFPSHSRIPEPSRSQYLLKDSNADSDNANSTYIKRRVQYLLKDSNVDTDNVNNPHINKDDNDNDNGSDYGTHIIINNIRDKKYHINEISPNKKYFLDPLEQYSNKGIDVPFVKPKRKTNWLASPKNIETKYLDPGPLSSGGTFQRALHIELFKEQTDKVSDRMNRLFS